MVFIPDPYTRGTILNDIWREIRIVVEMSLDNRSPEFVIRG